MVLIICVERLLHIGSHFTLRKGWRRPHFPTRLAAVPSFSYKIGGVRLIFQQNWRRRQGFGNITGSCSDMVWILDFYNSKTRCDRQKQIAFLKSALKSTLVKKEKHIINIATCNYRNNFQYPIPNFHTSLLCILVLRGGI